MAGGNNPFDKLKTSSYNFAGTDDVPRDLALNPTEDKIYTFEGDLRDADLAGNDGTPIDSKSRSSVTFSGDVYSNPWDAERQPGETRWTDSFAGRAATRIFSRGIVGATFMAFGNMALRTYNPHMPYEHMGWTHKRLKNIAGVFDNTIAPVIRKGFGEEAVNFRTARAFFTATPYQKEALKEISLPKVEEALDSINFDYRRFGITNEIPIVGQPKNANFEAGLKKFVEQPKNFGRIQRAEINLLAKKMKDPVIGAPFREVFENPASTLKQKRDVFDTLIKVHMPNTKLLFSDSYLDDLFKYTSVVGEGKDRAPRMLLSMINGRGLGDEMVGVTLDFAMGSFGDALGRAVMQAADPNYKKQWIEDGHINYGKLAKGVGQTLWQAVSYNQMEDWFTALPYVYYMKGQRKLLDNMRPGFKLASDNGLSASERFDADGKQQASFMREGAMDLQGRFMHYNFWTLLYRDLYNHGRHKLEEWKENGVHPEMPSVTGVVDGAGETAKYLAKSFIKSQMYMLPSVPFFWMWRVPQNKPDSVLMITSATGEAAYHSNYAPMTYQQTVKPFKDKDGRKYYEYIYNPLPEPGQQTAHPQQNEFTSLSPGWARLTDFEPKPGSKDMYQEGNLYMERQSTKPRFKPKQPYMLKDENLYTGMYKGGTYVFDRAMNHFGHINEKAVSAVNKHITPHVFPKNLFGQNAESFGRTWTNGAISYTPYMFAKDEFARLWDNEVTDAAIYRTLDGVGSMKWKDISEGTKDIWHAIWHQPVSEETYRQSLRQRGLINSRQDIRRLDENEQRNLASRAQSVAAVAAQAKQEQAADKPSTVIKTKDKEQEKEGWAPYEVARASMSDKTVPPGATIH